MSDDLDVMFTDAIADAVTSVQRMRVWTPSWVTEDDGDEDTRATLREIAVLRDANDKMRAIVHAKADRLPDDRWIAYRDILDANRIDDHDSGRADAAFVAWLKAGRPKGDKPKPWAGGEVDGFDCAKNGRRPCCVFEAWRSQVRTCRTWRDLVSSLPLLAEAMHVDRLVLPEDVMVRHVAQDVEVDNSGSAAKEW